MRVHRNPRKRLSKPQAPSNRPALPEPAFDYDGTLDVLRDNLGRVDAMLAAADEQFEELWGDDDRSDDCIRRRRNHVAYYMEAAILAMKEAIAAGQELDLHRGGR